MPPSFTSRFRVRFDECATDGTLRASALLRFVIETAFAHSEHAGFPLSWYDTHGLYWLVRRARLELMQTAPYGTLLNITTEVVGFRRIWARRRNTIEDSAGTLLGEVGVDWIFTDAAGRPARVVPEMVAAFPGVPDRLEVARLDLAPPPAGLQPDEYLVPAHQVDPRGHMNSAAYVDLFEDALAVFGADTQTRPVTYELEYFRPARFGEPLHRFVWEAPGAWSMLALDSSGEPAAKGQRRAT